jgi:predicted hydrolase (HD superfamily)
MPAREQYEKAVKESVEPNIFHHCLALEACMGGIYDYLAESGELGPNEPPREDWLLAGLVHDIDFSGEFKDSHPANTLQALKKHDLTIPKNIHDIVLAHAAGFPEIAHKQPENKAEWAILCADSLTGLISAVAIIIPSKKLADVKLPSILKRFHKEPKFASGTRREEVTQCELPRGLNIPVDDFIAICFDSMKSIAPSIDL